MSPRHLPVLSQAGFDVLSLANNHILDFGVEAFRETRRHLARLSILDVGAGENLEEARKVVMKKVKGQTFAFLAYSRTVPLSFSATATTPGSAFADEKFVQADIRKARPNADWVIVSLHWGREYESAPTESQRKLAHAAIQAGADLIIGHHPHVAQGFEVYQGKIIAYSLGNFVFGTGNPLATGALLTCRFNPGKAIQAEIHPLDVNNERIVFQPRELVEEPRTSELLRLAELSNALGTTLRIKNERAFLP